MSTQIELIKAKKELIEGYIMPFLGWDAADLFSFKNRIGCEFLQNYMPQYPDLIDEIVENGHFWNWWNNAWLLRDEGLLANLDISQLTQDWVVKVYKAVHNVDLLLRELHVDSIIFTGTSINKV